MKNFFSWPLFKENLKRFWAFSFVAFLCYFFSSSFIVLLDIESLDYKQSFISNILSCDYFPYTCFDIVFPIIASCLVFSYLFRVNSVGMMHSMPFNRKSLFITNYLSGLALVIIPMLANMIVLAILRQPVIANLENGAIATIYTGRAILKGFVLNSLIIFFSFAISSLAASISGNAVIEILTAAALNFIAPVTVLCFMCYKELFLFGYNGTDELENVAMVLHPAIQAYSRILYGESKVQFSVLIVLIYFVASLLISLAAYLLYANRKMERAGDSYVFDGVKLFIGACFVFFPATAGAMLLESWNELLGLLIGGCFGFLVGWMIVSKSFRIFNLKSLKAFLIGLVFTLAVVLFFAFDLGGYATRLPNIDNIESADLNIYGSSNNSDFHVTEKENIQSVINLHKGAFEYREENYDYYGSINITYNMKNGSTFSRYYGYVDDEFIRNSKEIRAIFESEENDADAMMLLNHIADDTIIDIQSEIYSVTNTRGEAQYSIGAYEQDDLKEELITALAQDLKERSYDEFLDDNIGWGLISITSFGHDYNINDSYTYSYWDYDENGKTNICAWNSHIMFNDDYEHVIAVLEKYDLLERILPNSSYSTMIITDNDYSYYENGYYNVDAPGQVIIKDTELQRMIIRNATYDFSENVTKPYTLHVLVNEYDFINNNWQMGPGMDMTYTVDYVKLPEKVQQQIREKI